MPSACPAPAIQEAEQRCAALSSAMPGPGWAPSIPARGTQLVLGFCPTDRESVWELDVHDGTALQPAPALTILVS